jgi:exodeoxyribonuclease VII small subunit
MTKDTPVKELNYEQAFTELDQIVAQMEEADQPLEQAMALFERGQALVKHCADLLDKAELKVQKLEADGRLSELE